MNTPVHIKRVAGGIWDKLGQRYESLWTVDALLSVLRGEAVSVTIEPHGEDGEGVELFRELAGGKREYLSAKRQTTSNIWSLAELTRPKETGRSVLGDLMNRLADNAQTHSAVFVSGTAANKLLRLCDDARRVDSLKSFEREIALNADLQGEFDEYILRRLGLDISSAWKRLARLQVHGCTEDFLRRCLGRDIDRDLMGIGDEPFSSAGARLVLYELVYERFGTPITRDDIIAHLARHRLAPRDWLRPTPDHENLERRNRFYCEAVEAELINGLPIPRKEVQTIITALGSGTRTVLLTAAAGTGKSCVLVQCLRALDELQIPHLAIRLDSQSDAATASVYGRSLGFSLSPAAVLSGVARGRMGVLIIDQLDALSTASGRNPRLWDLFRELLFEIEHFKHIQVLLACRAYDFEHDSRLRKLADDKTALRVDLELLDIDTVRKVLTTAGAPVHQYQQRHFDLLRTPLHLSVCLQADPRTVEPAPDLTRLYDAYWRCKRERASQRSPATRFEDTVQRLATTLSDRQSLTAPRDIFDTGGLASHAEALASDHVFVFDGNSCRFFHETFFDYTFARGFVASGKRLVAELLPQGREQHLFRRSQVRQVLAYQRGREGGISEYLNDLEHLLTATHIRTHVKKAVLDWLGHLSDPTLEEWLVITKQFSDASIGQFARFVPWNKPQWFVLLRDAGTFDAWLDSDAPETIDFAVRLLGLSETIKAHCGAIAALITKHLKDTPEWRQRFAALCEHGEFYHSREFFDLFMKKFRDGWFDGRMNRDWYGLAHLAKGNNEYAGEFLAEFLRRRFPGCADDEEDVQTDGGIRLHPHFFRELDAADPLPILRHVLPALADLLQKHARVNSAGESKDPLSPYLHFSETPRFADALVRYLVEAMSRVAKTAPMQLDALTPDLEKLSTGSAAFLLENAWAANPEHFANKAALYVASLPTRLDVSQSFVSGGDNEACVTRTLLESISPHVDDAPFDLLQSAIVAFRDEWEIKTPRKSGYTQLGLLLALPEGRLSKEAWHRLDELRRKFPGKTFGQPNSAEVYSVECPLQDEAAARMDDRSWLNAMRVYTKKVWFSGHGFPWAGPEHFAAVLCRAARDNKRRFAALAFQMEDTLPPAYFWNLLNGLMEVIEKASATVKTAPGALEPLDTASLLRVIERIHALPGKPCGKELCWAVKKIADRPLPESIIEMVAWYAQNDPNPPISSGPDDDGQAPSSSKGDRHFDGINSTRGAAAETINALLFQNAERWSSLKSAVLSLVSDRSLAVRSCAVGCLLARLRDDRGEAVTLFLELIEGADAILGTPYIDRFIHYAAFSHYPSLRLLLHRMLKAADEKIRESAARRITVAAFRHAEAVEDLNTLVLTGDEMCRGAAAHVFARNLGEASIAETCRNNLRKLFHDPSKKVREQADNCWRDLSAEELVTERALMRDFIQSPAFIQGVSGLQHSLEQCPEKLPEEVLLIPERMVELHKQRPAIDHSSDFYFTNASELVMRLYQQSRSNCDKPTATALETRCLNLIDAMLVADRGGMDGELRKLDQ